MALDVVVIGAGDLGLRLAALRAAHGDSVTAFRRRPLPVPDGVHAAYGDLLQRRALHALPAMPDWLVFCASPDARTESAYRQLYGEGLPLCLETLRPKRWLLVSSTAVYGQNAGEWVDAHSPAAAQSFNGRWLLHAERLCLAGAGGRVLRLSGIAGPGRRALVNRALLGEGIANAWSNRIQIDDAAAALSHLVGSDAADALYLASDDEPALQRDVANWIRSRHGLPPLPEFVDAPAGRRVSNAGLRAIGWAPHYPSYRESYAET